MELCGPGIGQEYQLELDGEQQMCKTCGEGPKYECSGAACTKLSGKGKISPYVFLKGTLPLAFPKFGAGINLAAWIKASGGDAIKLEHEWKGDDCEMENGTCETCTALTYSYEPSWQIGASGTGVLGPVNVTGQATGTLGGTIEATARAGECDPKLCTKVSVNGELKISIKGGVGLGQIFGGNVTAATKTCDMKADANTCDSSVSAQSWTCHPWKFIDLNPFN